MYQHMAALQFEAKPDKPDALYARKLQELLGGTYGEMTVAIQYMFQGWNCRMPGKYKDLIMDIGTEELGHVEMIATMIARLLEGAPAELTAEMATDPAVGAILGGQNPQHAIVAGGGALPANSNGVPWTAAHVVASGNLLADFYTNAAFEMQGRLQAARLYAMTTDPGVRSMLEFNLARDTMHQNMWLAAVQSLLDEGHEELPIPTREAIKQNPEWAYKYVALSDGPDGKTGPWAVGPSPDGKGTFEVADHPAPLGAVPVPPASDPLLAATAAVEAPSPGAPTSVMGKVKEKLEDAL